MRKLICVLVLLAPATNAALAQEAANKEALAAWEKYEKAQAEYRQALTKASAEVSAALKKGVSRDKALATFRAATAGVRETITKATDAFARAFAEADWNAFDADQHGKMLQAGLTQVAATATKESKFDTAIKAYQAILTKLPKSKGAARAEMSLGDLLAVKGDIAAARDKYTKALERNDAGTKAYLEQRLQLLGKKAPNIDSKQWIGGEVASLADLKGKVVVVDFWATWCGPCRVVMPGLSELYKQHKNDGLVVMGLTRFYKNGYLPANPKQMLGGGKSVKDMDEKDFFVHVKAFRDNTEMSYPFVIGEAENFKDYRVRGIPSVAVVGSNGNVALLAVGSGSEPLVRAVVQRELSKVKQK